MVNKEGKVLKPEQLEELQKIISSVKYGSVTLKINIIMNKVISDWKTRGHTSKT